MRCSYVFSEGQSLERTYEIPPYSRFTANVNYEVGEGREVSIAAASSNKFIAERSMYFDYQGTMSWGWKGGHCVFGSTTLDHYYFFAEGTTRTGFEEWITLQNPGENAITVDAAYQCGDTDTVIKVYDIPAGRRSTIFVPDEVGKEQDVSVQLYSSSEFLAERPMYFNYQGSSGWNWTGGHCGIGSITTDSKWILAEGYTGDGFEEWLCLHSPYVGYSPVDVTITYYPESGTPIRKEHTFPSGSRYTVYVNHDAGEGQAVAVEIQSSQAIVAERPMYFNYNGACTGGHIVVGCLPWSIVGWSR